jgi:hypothetical protein
MHFDSKWNGTCVGGLVWTSRFWGILWVERQSPAAETVGEKDETYAIVRLHSTFLLIMDHVHHDNNHANSTSSLLVVCSGAGTDDGLIDRLDQV